MTETTAKAFRREIDLKDGSGVQVFEGDTWEELADKLATAQENASKKIRQQELENKNLRLQVISGPERGEEDPDGPMPEFKERDLDPDAQFALGQRLVNPATAVAAHRELIEAELGAPLDVARGALRKAEATPRQLAVYRQTEAFLLRHPEFVNSDANGKKMVDYMNSKGMAFTVTNYERAYAALSPGGLLDLKTPQPSNNGATPSGDGGAGDSLPPAPGNATPRFASTSIATRGSGTPRVEPGPKLPTAEAIERMSAQEHRRWLNDPVHGKAFRDHEERIEAARAGRQRR